MRKLKLTNFKAEELLDKIEKFLFPPKPAHYRLATILEQEVILEKVLKLLEALTKFEHIEPIYRQDEHDELIGTREVGKPVRERALMILARWA